MRKLLNVVILLMLILTGCRLSQFGQHVEIEWVDFIKWNGKMYDGIYSGALADKTYLGEKLGEVKFKVADNVTDPEYKIRNGDAAFHEKGTQIFKIKGDPNLIAVKSASAINGYKIYFSRDDLVYKWQFQDMPIDKLHKIEIYQAYVPNAPKPIAEIKNPEQVSLFLQILKTSQASPNFQPNTVKGDPDYYHMVLYTGDPVAYMYDLHFDGNTYFWYPSEPSILSKDIQTFLPGD
ncbi:hypothetical protein V7150_24735 [Neobacillus drentensis]|uniref:hypothetical protein n=1 Tax=Neobacillus drentensis TaxID=220684 RepID=UPI002FFFFB0B